MVKKKGKENMFTAPELSRNAGSNKCVWWCEGENAENAYELKTNRTPPGPGEASHLCLTCLG